MPPSTLPGSADSQNKFEDLSGVDIAAYANPYDALIEACHNDPAQIQERYSTHRTTRNGQQKAKLLGPDFSGLIIDQVLEKLTDPSIEPGFKDPRHCLVFWARPPSHIRSLVGEIQRQLLTLAPTPAHPPAPLMGDPELWLMPLQSLHLTALEITHSLTSGEIASIIRSLGDPTVSTMTDYTYSHRARLIKPMLSYDGAAVALSFLPAAGESLPSQAHGIHGRCKEDDAFTYHHLRRDLFNVAKATGVSIDSRYVVPSSHITVGRFLTQADHDSSEKMVNWLKKIEDMNKRLRDTYWPKEESVRREDGEWIVGQERGLDFRMGTLWYGGGETVRIGKGFA